MTRTGSPTAYNNTKSPSFIDPCLDTGTPLRCLRPYRMLGYRHDSPPPATLNLGDARVPGYYNWHRVSWYASVAILLVARGTQPVAGS